MLWGFCVWVTDSIPLVAVFVKQRQRGGQHACVPVVAARVVPPMDFTGVGNTARLNQW